MTKKNNKRSRGFTLIELLVVIAIIGVLSSMLLVIIRSSTKSSQNAFVIGQMREYIKAINVRALETNTLPGGSYVAFISGCVGIYSIRPCAMSWSYTENPALTTEVNNYIQPQIPSLPNPNPSFVLLGSTIGGYGASYTCFTSENNECKTGYIFWLMHLTSPRTIDYPVSKDCVIANSTLWLVSNDSGYVCKYTFTI